MENKSIIEECKRYNENKPKWALIDFQSFIPVVKVMEMGIKKYGYDNWKKGRSFLETWESAYRHLIEFKEVSTDDMESKINHMAHLVANAMFLLYMCREKPWFDDRSIAEYPLKAKKSNGDKFENWKVSVIVNMKILNPEAIENIGSNLNFYLHKFYNEDKTPMESIIDMYNIEKSIEDNVG